MIGGKVILKCSDPTCPNLFYVPPKYAETGPWGLVCPETALRNAFLRQRSSYRSGENELEIRTVAYRKSKLGPNEADEAERDAEEEEGEANPFL